MKIAKNEKLYLREEVLQKTLAVRETLKKQGFDLKVYDGWRSAELQENLFWHYMKLFTVEKFGLKEQFDRLASIEDIKTCYECLSPKKRRVIFEANRTYVSWPTKELSSPSPHLTGGSVDVWLYKEGKAENLGVPFD